LNTQVISCLRLSFDQPLLFYGQRKLNKVCSWEGGGLKKRHIEEQIIEFLKPADAGRLVVYDTSYPAHAKRGEEKSPWVFH